jgi:hypothetical protein
VLALRVLAVATALATLALTGCPPNTAGPVPPSLNDPDRPPPDPRGDDDDHGGDVCTPDDDDTVGDDDDGPVLGIAGDPCNLAADCESGVCEGMGCGDGAGTCAAADRACTADVAQYCSCDGVTFTGSGSCPGARFQYRHACETKLAAGASCFVDVECGSGVCEGMGCGNDAPGVCAAQARKCTKDLRPYCGCDGQTFRTSGSCPGRRYESKGECKPGKPLGEECLGADDCQSGVCEGAGCGNVPGMCVAASRVCTKDRATYCGCDGNEFFASGSCPGQRYASKGACAAVDLKVDGDACLASSECASGTCEGQGCGPDEPGVCAPAKRGCTRDLRPYCGCDGQTFRTSGSCPGRRYEKKGEC